MRTYLRCATVLLVLGAVASKAEAQSYPSKPITMVVPYSAGGPTDQSARLIGEHMSRTLGQPVVIENVGGAGGTTGAARVAKAAPDGHTLLFHQVALAASGALYPRLPYSAAKDFVPVMLVNDQPMAIVARKDLPASNVKELQAWAKGRKVSVAHAGAGSLAHLCGVLFTIVTGLDANQVAYRGGAPAMNDVVAGHVDLTCLTSMLVVPQIAAGNVKGIGVTVPMPVKEMGSVPSLVADGFKEMNISFWQNLLAPAGTAEPIVEQINAAARKAVSDPEIVAKFAVTGTTVFPPEQQTTSYAREHFLAEIKRWEGFISKYNIIAK